MKRKGFTLIEIISVIVIIGIIALITVPITIRVIGEVKKRSFLITAEGIVKAASLSIAENEEDYESYFLENDTITFKFSKSEGKEGESVEEINGKKVKLSFDGKSPIGGEVKLYQNGDVEVINLTDGVYYVNKDVDTELVLTEDSTTLTRDELQEELLKLKDRVKDLEERQTSNEDKNKELESQIKNIDVLAKTYPVGSIYASTNSTNPATLFGGTWERYGEGQTLVGQKTSEEAFNTVDKTGGSMTHTHTGTVGNTTLTVDQIPSHKHTIPSLSGSTNETGGHNHAPSSTSYSFMITKAGGTAGGIVRNSSGTFWVNYQHAEAAKTATAGAHTHTVTTTASSTGNVGGGSSHTHTLSIQSGSNMQPYVVVYFWKRVA